ncbi:MAG: redoxin domain-containing protein [bacterium]|nr:redoxin domain-containing protein [bacterium]
MIRIGQTIPDLEVEAYQDDEIRKIRLAGYRGRWLILIFYPADFTFVCPTELEEAANYHDEFRRLGAEIMSVSTDTAFVHKAWHDHSPAIGKIRFPMIADPTGAMCRAFGTLIEEEGLSLRGSFVVDPQGVLRAFEMHDNAIGRSAAELLRKLQAAKFVSEHAGKVCPASWKPGQEPLTPGMDLVGKI